MLLLIWCNRFNQAPNVAQILMVTTRVPRIIYTFCIHLYFFFILLISKILCPKQRLRTWNILWHTRIQNKKVGWGWGSLENRPRKPPLTPPPPPTFRQTIILKTGLPLSLDKFSETSHIIEFSYDDARAFMMML